MVLDEEKYMLCNGIVETCNRFAQHTIKEMFIYGDIYDEIQENEFIQDGKRYKFLFSIKREDVEDDSKF